MALKIIIGSCILVVKAVIRLWQNNTNYFSGSNKEKMQFTPKEKYMCTLELVEYFRGIALSLNFFVKLNSLFLVKSTVQLHWDAGNAVNIHTIPLKSPIQDFSASALPTFWARQVGPLQRGLCLFAWGLSFAAG